MRLLNLEASNIFCSISMNIQPRQITRMWALSISWVTTISYISTSKFCSHFFSSKLYSSNLIQIKCITIFLHHTPTPTSTLTVIFCGLSHMQVSKQIYSFQNIQMLQLFIILSPIAFLWHSILIGLAISKALVSIVTTAQDDMSTMLGQGPSKSTPF